MTMAVTMVMVVPVHVIVPVIVSVIVGVAGRVGVQVATHGPEVESFQRNVNSSVIA